MLQIFPSKTLLLCLKFWANFHILSHLLQIVSYLHNADVIIRRFDSTTTELDRIKNHLSFSTVPSICKCSSMEKPILIREPFHRYADCQVSFVFQLVKFKFAFESFESGALIFNQPELIQFVAEDSIHV